MEVRPFRRLVLLAGRLLGLLRRCGYFSVAALQRIVDVAVHQPLEPFTTQQLLGLALRHLLHLFREAIEDEQYIVDEQFRLSERPHPFQVELFR